MKKQFKKGFTLAETLITLGIIGVISALTIPTLVMNYQSKVRITQLQKVYNDISNAAVAALADERVDSLDYTYVYEDINGAIDFLEKYLNVAKRCDGTNLDDCMAGTYSSLDGTASAAVADVIHEGSQCVALTSGASVCVVYVSAGDGYNSHGEISFVIDVNGPGAPNTNAIDLFQFLMYSDGTIGNSYNVNSDAASGVSCNNYKSTAGYGGSCFSKVVADGWKMDY